MLILVFCKPFSGATQLNASALVNTSFSKPDPDELVKHVLDTILQGSWTSMPLANGATLKQ